MRWPRRRTALARRVAPRPSTTYRRGPPPRGRASFGRARGTARARERVDRFPGSFASGATLHEGVRRLFVDRLCLLDRVRRRRRHVVLVVLGEHLARVENSVRPKLSLSHHTLALAEQIREEAAVDDRDVLRRVRDDELHGDAVGLALHASRRDHPADAERASLRHLFCHHLARGEKEHAILPERAEHEAARHAERNEAPRYHRQPLLSGLHRFSCAAAPWRRRRARALRLRNASSTISAITRPSVTR